MPEIETNAPYVTFINSFSCALTDQNTVVRINQHIIEQVARHADGFISASIHQSTDGRHVFNYLQWRTAEDLARMQASPAFRQIAQQFAGLIEFQPHQVEVVHVTEQQPNRGGHPM